MAMDENKLIEKLRKMTDESSVPESLEPENIMDSIRNKNISPVKPFVKRRTVRITAGIVSAAAALVIAFYAFFDMGQIHKSSDTAALGITSMDLQENGAESYIMAQTGNVDTYDEIYEKIEDTINRFEKDYQTDEIIFDAIKKEFSNSRDVVYEEMETAAATSTSTETYSSTNVQTVGIDEADIIKTDGKYIYYANTSRHTVTIYSTDSGKTEVVCSLYIDGLGKLDEIYVDGDTLLGIGSSYRDNKYNVTLVKYDISNREKPEYIANYMQEGETIETRKIDDTVFIVTRRESTFKAIKKEEPDTYIPKVNDELIPADCIYIPGEPDNLKYIVISSVDIRDMKKIDQAAVFGFDGTFYMGTENMYLYKTGYNTDKMTDIRKIDYHEDGNIGRVISATVPGQVKDTFAVNEYNGYLRIMTTSYKDEMSNNVFVLDSELNIVGSIEGLARNERIYSARYMGDVAYFVTYRETDPLFTVDLTDPYNPRILGELKIPGFSEYLHPYGNGLMLGIGCETVENAKRATRDMVKLSMFDISNPENVLEKDKTIVSDAFYTAAWYQYKLVMIDPDKNIFGFATEDENGSYSYRVFTYTENGFDEILRCEISDYQLYLDTRSVYIGNYIYIVNGEGIKSYSITTAN